MTDLPDLDLPEGLKIERVIEKTKWSSNQMYLCEATNEGEPLELFIKIYQKEEDVSRNEGPALAALSEFGIPVPRVYGSSSRNPSYVAVGRIQGTSAPDLLREVDEGERINASNLYARRIGESLAKIHGLDLEWSAAPEAGGGVHQFLSDESFRMKHSRKVWKKEKRYGELFLFLRENEPTDRFRVFTHGDHHFMNVLFNEWQISGVVDWESCGIGWREFDLGWTVVARAGFSFLRPLANRESCLSGYRKYCDYDEASLIWNEIRNYLHYAYWNGEINGIDGNRYIGFALERAFHLVSQFEKLTGKEVKGGGSGIGGS